MSGDIVDPMRDQILNAFGVTEEQIAALDPDGSYARAVADRDAEIAAFRRRIETEEHRP